MWQKLGTRWPMLQPLGTSRPCRPCPLHGVRVRSRLHKGWASLGEVISTPGTIPICCLPGQRCQGQCQARERCQAQQEVFVLQGGGGGALGAARPREQTSQHPAEILCVVTIVLRCPVLLPLVPPKTADNAAFVTGAQEQPPFPAARGSGYWATGTKEESSIPLASQEPSLIPAPFPESQHPTPCPPPFLDS